MAVLSVGSLESMGTGVRNEDSRADPCQSLLCSSRGPFEMNIGNNRLHQIDNLIDTWQIRLRLYIANPPSDILVCPARRGIKRKIKRNDPTSNECNGFKPGGVENDKERTTYIKQDKYRTDQLLI